PVSVASLATLSLLLSLFSMTPRPPPSTLFPYTTLFRSLLHRAGEHVLPAGDDHVVVPARHVQQSVPVHMAAVAGLHQAQRRLLADRKSTRLNSSHVSISYAVFCLKKKKQSNNTLYMPSV